jgi:hypothetical protein
MEGFPRTILLAVLMLAGARPSLHGEGLPSQAQPALADTQLREDPQIERGQPHKVIDAVGWAFGIPRKLILWDRRAVNHRVSAETEQNLTQYLDSNGLRSTKVRINEYDPVGELRRLRTNKNVGAGWRYTIGAFGAINYTLFPGRLFGADGYNPYTDSVYIYSDIPCIAQEQASYAKLIHAQPHPGTYVALTSLPFVQLWPQKEAKTDVLDYTLANGTPAQQYEATHILFAEYGAEVGRQTSVLFGAGIPLTLAGAGVGHVAANAQTTSCRRLPPTNSDSALPASEVANSATTTLDR